MRALAIACAALGLAACASQPKQAAPDLAALPAPPPTLAPELPSRKASPYAPAQEDPSTRGDYVAGGLYKPGVADSAPDFIPDVDAIPEPEIKAEPRSRAGNRSSYAVLGKTYRVLDDTRGFVEQGVASYYGQKFHGRRTSNLEVYDMYAFTAAHKSLPLPSFARVTHLGTGKSVVVRVNDRGPFHPGRVIDLSYAAAVKLGITRTGTARVEVRALHPGDPGTVYAASGAPAPAPAKAMGAVRTDASVAGSALDRLVATMPVAAAGATATIANAADASPAVPVVGSAAADAPAGHRFDMHQDGRTMSADEFDAWMRQRRVRVATGRPAAVPRPDAASTPAVLPAAAPPPALELAASGVTLQVASFAARDNADRALAMLHGAGIGNARLHDGLANGQKVWRLRVGPLAAAGEAELAARIVGLGFSAPQRVRE